MTAGRTDLSSPYSPDYASARERFRTAAASRGFLLESIPIGLTGPSGENLTIDVARRGAARPERVLVVSSGVHGVEGFFGSAAQTAFLEGPSGGRSLGANDALVFLHALNPYGFAWVRRFNEANVDLNRNMLVEGQPYRGAPRRYAALNRLLNPEGPPTRFNLFFVRSLLTILRYGMGDLKAAIAEGQYDYPRGIFFGGHGPSQTQQILAQNLRRWIGGANSVLHLDFHTGLGQWATYRLLLEPGARPDEVEWAKRAFGPERVDHFDTTGIAYPTRGDIGTWCRSLFPHCRYHYHCAEFGTYPPLRVVSALRAENQAYHTLSPGEPALERARHRLKEMFAPADPAWRRTTIAAALELLDRASDVVFDPGTAVSSSAS